MKVTVCEFHEEREHFEQDWAGLVRHVKDEASDFVLLPEFPFSAWFPVTSKFDVKVWDAAVAAHEAGLARLHDLAPASVLGTRPVNYDGRRFSEGFVWDQLTNRLSPSKLT